MAQTSTKMAIAARDDKKCFLTDEKTDFILEQRAKAIKNVTNTLNEISQKYPLSERIHLKEEDIHPEKKFRVTTKSGTGNRQNQMHSATNIPYAKTSAQGGWYHKQERSSRIPLINTTQDYHTPGLASQGPSQKNNNDPFANLSINFHQRGSEPLGQATKPGFGRNPSLVDMRRNKNTGMSQGRIGRTDEKVALCATDLELKNLESVMEKMTKLYEQYEKVKEECNNEMRKVKAEIRNADRQNARDKADLIEKLENLKRMEANHKNELKEKLEVLEQVYYYIKRETHSEPNFFTTFKNKYDIDNGGKESAFKDVEEFSRNMRLMCAEHERFAREIVQKCDEDDQYSKASFEDEIGGEGLHIHRKNFLGK